MAASKLNVCICYVVYPNTGPNRNYHHSSIVSFKRVLKQFEVQETVLV